MLRYFGTCLEGLRKTMKSTDQNSRCSACVYYKFTSETLCDLVLTVYFLGQGVDAKLKSVVNEIFGRKCIQTTWYWLNGRGGGGDNLMKARGGGGMTLGIPDLDSRRMWLISFMPRSLLLSVPSCTYWLGGWVGFIASLDVVWKRKYYLSCVQFLGRRPCANRTVRAVLGLMFQTVKNIHMHFLWTSCVLRVR
jgi:hypothetical protein